MAAFLAGAWRQDPPALAVADEDLARVAPLLIGSGAAALAWNRIARQPPSGEHPALASLQEAYRFLALEEMRKEASLGFIADLFARAGIEPMIFKGWAVAQHYAKPHLRPFGDFDLCAPPGRYTEAAEILRRYDVSGLDSPGAHISQELGLFTLDFGQPGSVAQIDLHASLDKFRLPPVATLYARSQRIAFGKHVVRIPAAEDHLRLLAIHFLKHGGWRPLWLCDVAAMLETLPENPDWELCFGRDSRVAHWIACVFELAHRLLDARIDCVPAAHRIRRLPTWFVRTVLNEWRAPFPSRFVGRPFADSLVQPRIIPAELMARWPNGIRATVEISGRFNSAPRLAYQLANFTGLIARRLTQPPFRPTPPRPPSV